MRMLRLALIAVLLAGLAGCASGPRIVSADVRTSAAQPPGAAVLHDMRYRFESAVALVNQPAPDKLQALAQEALTRVGAQRDDAAARVGVQVSGSVNVYWSDGVGSPWGYAGSPRFTFGLGVGRGWHGGGLGIGFGGPLWSDPVPIYASEVGLLMRDLQSGQIVYDTRARHDGTWLDADAVLKALFAAALEGFPNPPAGPQRVDVPLLPAAR